MSLKVSVNSYDIKKFLVIAAFVSLFQKAGLLNLPWGGSNLVNQESGVHPTSLAIMSFVYGIYLCDTNMLCLLHVLLPCHLQVL